MPSTNLSVIPAIGPASVAKVPLAVQDAAQGPPPMFYHIARNGSLEALFDRTGYDEVMLRCARIGYKP
jgi:hypothetical protein